MLDRAKLNDVAPRDVKQLEVLKPINTPSMGERYKQSIEKEKRLEAASRPIQKKVDEKRKAGDDAEEAPAAKKKKKSKKNKKSGSHGKLNEEALDQEDEVEEGINWSDDEE